MIFQENKEDQIQNFLKIADNFDSKKKDLIDSSNDEK